MHSTCTINFEKNIKKNLCKRLINQRKRKQEKIENLINENLRALSSEQKGCAP